MKEDYTEYAKNHCGCTPNEHVCDCTTDETVSNCECGCTEDARESVKLTDAEIAKDILWEVNEICGEYASLLAEGYDCTEKLRSCEKLRSELTEYVNSWN